MITVYNFTSTKKERKITITEDIIIKSNISITQAIKVLHICFPSLEYLENKFLFEKDWSYISKRIYKLIAYLNERKKRKNDLLDLPNNWGAITYTTSYAVISGDTYNGILTDIVIEENKITCFYLEGVFKEHFK